jgi:O-antigen ligase
VTRALGRAQEVLWLAAALGIPIIILTPGLVFGYAETPEVALLRTLAAMMAVLWMVEWAVKPFPRLKSLIGWRPAVLRTWLATSPMNWAVLSLAVLIVAFLLSTAFSAYPHISIWGRRPGGDGYDLYSVLSYTVLFAVVATHLRTYAQVIRLLTAISSAGVLVGAYAISQHFGFDPWLSDIPSPSRSISSLGNPVFAGAVLLMTSLATTTVGLAASVRGAARWPLALATVALAVQIVGLTFTLSRGPWVASAAGGAAFLGFLWVAMGWRTAARGAVMIGTALSIAVITVVATATIEPPQKAEAEPSAPSSDLELGTRALSLYGEVVGGGLSGRAETWKGAVELATERPWPEVEKQRNAWARQVFGYGPDLYRYVSPLRSPPSPFARFPFEAHNVVLHAWVELGVVGALALLAAGLSVGAAGFAFLGRHKQRLTPLQRVFLTGLLALLAGRSIEMMVGIPRVGDLTLVALVVAAFVAVPRLVDGKRVEKEADLPEKPGASAAPRDWVLLVTRAGLVWIAIVALGVFTWFKAVNYARADGFSRLAVSQFDNSPTPDSSIRSASAATNLAPDVVPFWLTMADIFENISENSAAPDLKLRTAIGRYVNTRDAVAANLLDPDARAAEAFAALNLYLLGEPPEQTLAVAVRRAEDGTVMLPRFAIAQYDAARVHLFALDPERALVLLDRGDSLYDRLTYRDLRAQSLFFRAQAYNMIGGMCDAERSALEESLQLSPEGAVASSVRQVLAQITCP